MSKDCGRIRDEIAGLITDGAPNREAPELRQHLDSCPACRDYLRALQQEDALLGEHFATLEADMAQRQERLWQALEHVNPTKQTHTTFVWRGIMRNQLSKIAIAATIVIAAGVGIHHFGGRLDGTSVAWAGVDEKLSQVHDYFYREREIDSSGVKMPGFEFRSEWETWWYYSSIFGHRWDKYRAKELISQYYVLLKKQQCVWIHPDEKTFSCRPEQLPETAPLDPAGQIRQILAESYVKLGRTTIDGVLVEGVEVQGQKVGSVRLDNAVSRLWVNVETELPVWLEAEGKIHNSETYARVIWDKFQWNVNLTEADFTPAIPTGFTQKDWPTDNTRTPDLAVASAQKNVMVDFRPLQELGLLGSDQTPTQPPVALTGLEEIHAARDEVMSHWPKYADLRDSLRQQELDRKLNLKSSSVEKLVQLGVLLREKYWDVGGDFSPASYRYGYLARVLLEIAHERQPNDLGIGDELAETIMSTQTMSSGPAFWDVLRELRDAQFRQVRAEVDKGRRPVWEDFARVSDLVNLYREPAERLAVIDWLTGHAQAGGWTAYGELLEWMRTAAAQPGAGLGYSIYRPTGSEYPEEFRYGGRLPSFRGPQKRAVVPSRPLQPAPVQQPNQ